MSINYEYKYNKCRNLCNRLQRENVELKKYVSLLRAELQSLNQSDIMNGDTNENEGSSNVNESTP